MNKIKLGVIVTSLYLKPNKKEIALATKKLSKYFDVKLYLPDCKPDRFGSIPTLKMIEQINIAANENEVLLSLSGGFNQIELLLSFERFKFRPENIFVGQSDNTLLVSALPSLGVCKSLYGKGFYDIATDRENAEEIVEELYRSIIELKSADSSLEPVLLGGNNYTFDLLQGTRFCPKFNQPFILFMEGEDVLKDPSEVWRDFIRNIDSIALQNKAMDNLRGLILGKFPESIQVSDAEFNKFKKDRPYLKNIPVIRDFKCGHNKESFIYLPIGQRISVEMLNLIERKG
jgi:muramoyltetrapeptide carboxypeptidase LdcA involved in peptidoglycan recycling